MSKTRRRYMEHDTIPHLCHIETTYACNQNCIFCYNPQRHKLGDINKVDKIVESVAKSRIPHVYLIGGEPSLLPTERINYYIELLSKHSSVTIVTNGYKRLEGISKKLACFGVPIHGSNAETHEFLNQKKGSFKETLENIEYYVSNGYDVRCIPVLMGYNYDEIYNIIGLAAKLRMESIYVDRYEDGGIGALNSEFSFLKPTEAQFREALTQMIQAREDFTSLQGRVGFGTAIPYCLDERLITEGLTSNCGVGTYFGAINPDGDFRMCNQSEIVFGNVLEEPIEKIWNKPSMDMFRNLSWVNEPCSSCELLLECGGGCKVDINCSDKFCIDYAARGKEPIDPKLAKKLRYQQLIDSYPEEYREFKPSRYTKLNTYYKENFLVTRYQTVKLDKTATGMARAILNGIRDERSLIQEFSKEITEREIRLFISRLFQVNALKEKEVKTC